MNLIGYSFMGAYRATKHAKEKKKCIVENTFLSQGHSINHIALGNSVFSQHY